MTPGAEPRSCRTAATQLALAWAVLLLVLPCSLAGEQAPAVGIAPAGDAGTPPGAASANPWQSLEPGLDVGQFAASQVAPVGDSRITVLRIDPQQFDLQLHSASSPGNGTALTAKQWCLRAGGVAAINASMYQTDGKTSVALMRTRNHVNNAKLRLDRYKAVLALDPLAPGLPRVRILDRECDEFETLRTRYGTLVQNERLLSCGRQNVWAQNAAIWSTAAVGLDGAGRVLFIHCRSPYSVHDLIDMLLRLPIDLQRAMYVEGGPEAQLYCRSGSEELDLVGSLETGFYEQDANAIAWPVPNVICVVRRPAASR